MNMASAGNGSGTHMARELFKMLTGVNLTHVPYRGGARSISSVTTVLTRACFYTHST